jgi:hypothetical protein
MAKIGACGPDNLGGLPQLLMLRTNVPSFQCSFVCQRLKTEMARVRFTARVAREGEEVRTSETAPISKMIERYGLVVQEDKELIPTEDVVDAEAEPTIAKDDNENEDEDDDGILSPSKPSHIEFRKSTVMV